MRQQPRQLGTGFRAALAYQAGFQIFARLAPQLVLQAQPAQGQQELGVIAMLLQPAFGGLQLVRAVAATSTAIEVHQTAVVAFLEGLAQHFLGLFRRAQTQQLFGIGGHQRWLRTKVGRYVLPALGQRLQAAFALADAPLARLAQRSHPGTALQVRQLGVLQHALLAQLGQQYTQRLPFVEADVELLEQAQHGRMTRMILVQLVQHHAGAGEIAAIDQQLRAGQTHGKLSAGLALLGAVQQFIALVGLAQLVGRARGAQVMRQRAVAQFGGTPQVAQRLRPVSLGEIALAMFLGQVRTAPTVEARPGVHHPPGDAQQAQCQTYGEVDHPERYQQREEGPQARFVAETLVGNQHVA